MTVKIDLNSIKTRNENGFALLEHKGRTYRYKGQWVPGSGWEIFGLYGKYFMIREDGAVMTLKGHAGELVPGSTEDLSAVIDNLRGGRGPFVPMTIEIDPTYSCLSKNCGGHCFSYGYRNNKNIEISAKALDNIVDDFHRNGGKIVRFDGGGEPLLHDSLSGAGLIRRCNKLGLKTAVLTSGDAVIAKKIDLLPFGENNCYLRFSINAATDRTRTSFHGNNIKLTDILSVIEAYCSAARNRGYQVPVGATFLISKFNYKEMYDAARTCKDLGISHFSARRILGKDALRYKFTASEEKEISGAYAKMHGLASSGFKVFTPWRPLNEPDFDPSSGSGISDCWQARLKAVIEPDENGHCRIQLCGRCRGNTQEHGLSPIVSGNDGEDWVKNWSDGINNYKYRTAELPRKCVSCIDSGFIRMLEAINKFSSGFTRNIRLLHFNSSGNDGELPGLSG